MIAKFHTILRALCDPEKGREPLTGIRAIAQFAPEKDDPVAGLRNLNAAFLVSLCGPGHPSFETVENYLSEKQETRELKQAAAFYDRGRGLVTKEFLARCTHDTVFSQKVMALYGWIRDHEYSGDEAVKPDQVWQVFFPEGVGLFADKEEHIRALRERRAIAIERLNPHPMKDPSKELLFTANALLTVPPDDLDIASLPLSAKVRDGIERARGEPQLFWYDHPVQIGTPVNKNEIVYGLRELNRAIAFEKKRNTVERNARVVCLLSVSVTHRGLREIAGAYLRELLQKTEKLEHLRVFAFTEADTAHMAKDILVPAAKHWFGDGDTGSLPEIFGVDGEYGRHYSFLKAVAALWQVFVDPGIRGTFKIDLDQVFPQEQLVRETGVSALEHFRTPLWGAEGIDFERRKVDMGMIAGALVNREDSKTSLLVPDVPFPPGELMGSEWIFFSRLPQAVSTEAEMMTRYGKPPLDGLRRVIQRVHVTGGTTGILVDQLRKYRPFTPGFVGRAEDQAYLLSELGQYGGKPLRSLHKDGLIMRHDKEAFAEEAIQAAAMGKKVGDYIRILIFSAYAGAIHDDVEFIKREVDPFTGCFISRLPMTIVYLRFAMDVASLFHRGKEREAMELEKMGIKRIGDMVQEITEQKNMFRNRFEREKRGWNLYYDILDRVEQGLEKGDSLALDLQRKARHFVKAGELSNF
jgi:hypothetical protein